MDQNAFRNLLSTQAVKPGTGRSAGVLGTHAAKRSAGKSKNAGGYTFGKNAADAKSQKEGKDGEDTGSAMAFAPRKAGGKKGKDRENGKQDNPYQDRAELRRLGKDDEANEFKAAEKLAEDFEKRAREEGQDEEKIEEQRKYLGGDATHSILVKGLDYALLAARKAEIEATEGKKAEDELDALFEGESAAAAGANKGQKDVEEKSSGVGRKRTREEIVQQLKRQRTGANAESGEGVAAPVAETLGSKFKSIAQKKREAEEAQAQAQGKKKLKKKKKILPSSTPATEPAVSTPKEQTEQSVSTTDVAESGKEQHAGASEKSSKGTTSAHIDQAETTPDHPAPAEKAKSGINAPIPGVTPIPDEDDDDIFGGVGEYVGAVATDSDSDSDGDVERKPSPRSGKDERRRLRSRSRSRSPAHRDDDRHYSARRNDRYGNDSYRRSRSREDRSNERDRYGNYSRNDRSSRRSRSPYDDRDRRLTREDRHSRTEGYDEYASHQRYERDGRYRQARSRSRERYYRSDRDEGYRARSYRRENSRSPSRPRSPYRQEQRRSSRSPPPRRPMSPPRHSRSRSPPRKDASPPPKPIRSPSRSPSPVNIDALRALSHSSGLSDGEDDPYRGPVRPGQSLRALGFASSDVPSARELLEMDAIANQADQKRANKAKWRKAQGLAPQEGAGQDDDDDGGNKNRLGQELTEQQKMRRDQQRLQAYMEKKEKAAK